VSKTILTNLRIRNKLKGSVETIFRKEGTDTMGDCNHDCSNCSSGCDGAQSPDPKSFIEDPHPDSNIKSVIGIMSGKGGVGKSMVTDLMAVAYSRNGHRCGIMDADITGPSIPKAFGVTEKATGNATTIFPVTSKTGIDIISINLLLENETDPVIWRGPVIAGTVKQFWTDVLWKDIDCLFVDMPPGTGDVPLTVFQSLPLDGIIVVTTPQDLVSMIVGKAVKMAEMMNIPVLGIIENMSYVECPDCGKRLSVFGESRVKKTAAKYELPILSQLPIDPKLTEAIDAGAIEEFSFDYMDDAVKIIENMNMAVPNHGG
jgi:Mrp family chromosome partitioning ATPase